MTPPFRRHGDAIRMELETDEVTLLRNLHDTLRGWLADPDPADPIMARLFPPCAPEDDLVDAEVRSLIFEDLLSQRIDGLDELVAILDRGKSRGDRLRVDLKEDEPDLMLSVLNDIRLALAARIGFEVFDQPFDDDHPAAWARAVIDHLASLQELLLRVLDPTSTAGDL